jgi:lysophospholipase L1-like esterase
MEATLPGAIRILREAHATVPILVISRIPFADDITHEDCRIDRDRCREMQAAAVQTAMENGDGPIEFLDGSTLLGDDFDECTVDGVHPTDLGFMRMARGLAPEIERILEVG